MHSTAATLVRPICGVAALVLIGAGAWGAEPSAERVISAVTSQYAGIKSARVRGTSHDLASGGLRTADPAGPVTYQEGGEVCEFEHWSDPPRLRVFDTKSRNGRTAGVPVRWYFDGATYTDIRPVAKQVALEDGGGRVRPIASSPLHAIGFSYPLAYRGSFADLLSDPTKVRAERAPDHRGRPGWLLEVTPIPAAIQPMDFEEVNRKNTVVRLWVSTNPDVLVWKWGHYERRWWGEPGPNDPPEPSAFALNGHRLNCGYVNLDSRPVVDAATGKPVPMPHRVVFGNAFINCEYKLQEVAINPPRQPDSFRPAPPRGYLVRRDGRPADEHTEVAGGAAGEEIRVGQITQEARDMLDSPASISAPGSGWRDWLVWIGGALLVLGGLVPVVVYLRRRVRR
ncbi:MAG: hypothetical protein JWO38_2153 [Gemmataceae bacterium]|nr:hypothetical protein [Gemmataceae bacterium]